jgi:hypothetical protein
MTNLVEKVMAEIEKYAPNIPIIQIVEAIIETIENPVEEMIIADIQMIMLVYTEVKMKLKGIHPDFVNILKALI